MSEVNQHLLYASSMTTLLQLKKLPVLRDSALLIFNNFSSLAGNIFHLFSLLQFLLWNFTNLHCTLLIMEIADLSWLCSCDKSAFISEFIEILISVILDLNWTKMFLSTGKSWACYLPNNVNCQRGIYVVEQAFLVLPLLSCSVEQP